MKLRIFPREESYFDLFDEIAANLADAAGSCWIWSRTSSTRR